MEKKDLSKYTYAEGQTIEIDAQLFSQLNNFMYSVIQEGMQLSYFEMYPSETKENHILNDGEQVLDRVEVEYKPYPNMASFTSQQPVWSMSPTAMEAKTFAFTFGQIHEENIKNGVAIEREELPKTV